jgi:Ser/Thr protein kinase RdoA (MazF antagonist)
MSERVKVHGMDGKLVEPDWPPLTLAELRDLFVELPQLGEPQEIVFTSPRPLSAAARVRTPNGTFFVKRHAHSVRDREGLLEEHSFLAHLHAKGAPVPQVFSNASSESAIQIGEWTYEVHEAAPGIDLYRDAISWTPFFGAGHAHEAGRALARLHLAAGSFTAPARKVQPLVASFSIFAEADASVAMDKYLSSRPALANHAGVRRCAGQALDVLAPFHKELQPLLPHLHPLWTHNDLHASNLLWNSDSISAHVTAIIDFGLADRTNDVYDLANAIERNMIGWLQLVQHPDRPDDVPFQFSHIESLLTGYESVRPLSHEEAAALAPMVALCHTEFALSEADYFLGVLHSEESARMAYDGWLVGHARWFQSARGNQLIDWLKHWAEQRSHFVVRAAHS